MIGEKFPQTEDFKSCGLYFDSGCDHFGLGICGYALILAVLNVGLPGHMNVTAEHVERGRRKVH